jgi:hypothetical protein
MNILRWIFWAVCFLLRAVLIVIGWVLPPLWYETTRTQGMNIFQLYWENSIRNPTPYLRGVFKQPIPEVKPNPDALVRAPNGMKAEATRTMVSGPYIEYWKLSRRDASVFYQEHPYWEFRIGWKFVDGEETFYPTFQFHLSK